MMATRRLCLVFFSLLFILFVTFNVAAGGQEEQGIEEGEVWEICFVGHADPNNPHWNQIVRGFEDTKKMLGVKGEFLNPTTGADVEWQTRTIKSLTAKGVDGIITSILNDSAYDEAIAEAVNKGIPVIAAIADDPEGADGNARVSFIGQDFESSGYTLAKSLITENWPGGKPPAPKDMHVLLTYALIGTIWEERRGEGIKRFLKEYGVPDENISILDSSEDTATQQTRTAAFFQAHPDTNCHLSVQIGHAGAYLAAEALGYQPGKIAMGGFDIIPIVLDGIEKGYIQCTVDQQPYLQGSLPVLQIYFMKKFGLAAWDVNTGLAIKTKKDLAKLKEQWYSQTQ